MKKYLIFCFVCVLFVFSFVSVRAEVYESQTSVSGEGSLGFTYRDGYNDVYFRGQYIVPTVTHWVTSISVRVQNYGDSMTGTFQFLVRQADVYTQVATATTVATTTAVQISS